VSKIILSQQEPSLLKVTRRDLIKGIAGLGAAALCAPAVIIPKISAPTVSSLSTQDTEKQLSFYNLNTGEYLKKCTFWAEGQFNNQALDEIKHFFRDYRTGQIHPIDQDLLNLLHKMVINLDTQEIIHLISGYRAPATNKKLAAKSKGIAVHSQHLLGKAADIAIPGRSMKQIQQAAKDLKMGGVGRYRDFVHIDTGRVRYWGLA
jgi:uncharacterized protein YcbK (DUF882 family)